uniref:Gnk2-homologous domain-containing protein n=1 Tax=Quercus lobata TaxID=97700 RepID=A0A7N2MBN5_QUELO
MVQLFCPQRKVAFIWYNECMIRYSNRSFFLVMEDEPRKILWNVLDRIEPDRFLQLTFGDLVPRAANASSSAKKFATKETKFTELQTPYNLVQCTPNLSSFDCSRCLWGAITKLPTSFGGNRGGRVLYPSCNIRYETFSFYPIQAITAPGPGPKGKGKISTVIAIVIGVTIAASEVLVILLYCFLRRSARKKSNDINKENSQKSDCLLIYHVLLWFCRFVGGLALSALGLGLVEVLVGEATKIESMQFDFGTIEAATNKFADYNMIGKVGFGKVYKGVLHESKEAAVKRSSTKSLQGLEELKNEVILLLQNFNTKIL